MKTFVRKHAFAGATSLLVVVSVGCMRPLSQLALHTQAFSSAAILVTNGSEDAYSSANTLHYNEQIALAVIDYDKNTSWDPAKYVKPLLSDDQLEARRQVLEGLKTYAETLSDLTSTKGNADLNAAAKNIGNNLQQLSTTVNTSFKTSTELSISNTQKDVLSTALVALGNYLQQRIVSKRLPEVLQANDKTVSDICDALLADVKILRRQADKDYGELEIAQDSYIRHAQPPFTADERRTEIAKLPAMIREQQQNDLLLSKLEKSLGSLKLTHHALAAAAQGNNPGSLHQYIAELTAEGQSLTSYYQSLSSK